MAGKTLPEIYCAKMKMDRLIIYLASTGKGAFRVGLGLDRSIHPVDFFRHLLPALRLTENDRYNRSLAEAVEGSPKETPFHGYRRHPFSMDGVTSHRNNTLWTDTDLWCSGVDGRKVRGCQGRGPGYGEEPPPPHLSVTSGGGRRGPRRFWKRIGGKAVFVGL